MPSEVSDDGVATPVSAKVSNLTLTESALATPTSEKGEDSTAYNWGIPDDYLLPNGYPDVSALWSWLSSHLACCSCDYYLQYLRLILTSRVYDIIDETPLHHAVNLSNRLECRVLLKREDLLPVFSFKLRGAYNKMAHLTHEQRWKGVIACSAGEQPHYFDR